MNFKMAFGASALLVFGGLFAIGCGNACDDLADAIESKYEECGIDIPDGGGDAEGGECTDEAAKLAECLTPCYEDAECDAIKDPTSDAAKTYSECVMKCSTGG